MNSLTFPRTNAIKIRIQSRLIQMDETLRNEEWDGISVIDKAKLISN
jgi:hypothetical protein